MNFRFTRTVGIFFTLLLGCFRSTLSQEDAHSPARSLVVQFCLDCHNHTDKKADLDLERFVSEELTTNSGQWERVVRKLHTRQMPPPEMPRPTEQAYALTIQALENSLDQLAQQQPRAGRTETFRRLNRAEYQNAIRDLLHLDISAASLLPADQSSQGFDNITVTDLSPTLLERYLLAAQKISRLAIGNSSSSPDGDTFRVQADVTQEEHVEGLPIGTRGGMLIPYTVPRDGEYEIQIRLTRDRNEEVEGLTEQHDVELLVDRRRIEVFTVAPPTDGVSYQSVDQHLKARVQLSGGPHQVGVTFLKLPSSLLETKRQPYHAHYNMHRHPRITPAIYQVSITGPFETTQLAQRATETPSRQRIFVCRPRSSADEASCAKEIFATLMRRAYRRAITDADLQKPLELYRAARAEGDFDAGIELGLSAILVNPNFLFRIERDPAGVPPNTAYRISDVELATRLSFFLWSSIPDDELLDLAIAGLLSNPDVYSQQVQRMLNDARSRSLAQNFAGQWLHLRNLDSMTPDLRLFPDFDDNLRQSLRRETELLFESVMRDDRSVLELVHCESTFLNERLAKHYQIPHIYGSRFRKVLLDGGSVRGGLLRHGSILTATSYATRTSPVLRGKWVLENILGTPPPPPPENVPALKDNTISSVLSVRERLAEHRANIQCASCHDFMDPVGFSLENFDAIGRWRTVEEGKPVDVTGGLPDGSEFAGVQGLEQAILKRPEVFVRTLTEKLLTYAIGRGAEDFDGPAIRQIVRQSQADGYRMSSVIEGIATSTPFQMRDTE